MTDLPESKLIPRCSRCHEPVHNKNHKRLTTTVVDCRDNARIADVTHLPEERRLNGTEFI